MQPAYQKHCEPDTRQSYRDYLHPRQLVSISGSSIQAMAAERAEQIFQLEKNPDPTSLRCMLGDQLPWPSNWFE
jgi:hypothetical protein